MFVLLLLTVEYSRSAAIIDEILAIVGNEPVFASDIEQELMQQKAQGRTETSTMQCEIFEQLLIQKLLLAQARRDSLKVNDLAVTQEVDQRLRFFTAQLGGQQEVEKYFNKPLSQIRKDLQDYVSEHNLTQQMQQSIVSKVALTPKEAEVFYASQAPDSFPMLPEQYVMQQIVRYPPSGQQARYDVRERLIELRERIMNGEKFSTLAVLYSEDPGSAKRGGELGLRSREEFVKQFSDVAFSLRPNQVSQIVETEFGYHIIQLIEKKGDMANVRHILLKPKFSGETQERAVNLLDSVANIIRKDSVTFEMAAMRYSEDKETLLNGGYVINPATQTSRFEKDQVLPADYFVLRAMKVGEISQAFASKDARGNDNFKIVKLTQILPAHRANFEQDYGLICDIARQQQQQQVFEQWIKTSIESAVIDILPKMQTCHYKYNWQKK